MLESYSIIAAAITIYCGLFYLSGALNEETKVVFFIIILLVNINFFFTWIKVFYKEFTNKIRKQHTKYYYMFFRSCILVQPYLKFKSKKKAIQSATMILNDDLEMRRGAFLGKQVAGHFKNNNGMTDKQFKEILANKGKMCMKIMKNEIDRENVKWEKWEDVQRKVKIMKQSEFPPLPTFGAHSSVPGFNQARLPTDD